VPTIGVTGWIGAGTREAPFTPDFAGAGLRWAAIDLRSNPTTASGTCVVVVDGDLTLTKADGSPMRQTSSLDRLDRTTARLFASDLGINTSTVRTDMSIGELIRSRLNVEVRNGKRRIEALGCVLYEGD
jgi:hypothetical protein